MIRNERDYFLQFEGQEHEQGTRYTGRIVHKHSSYGVAYDCLSIPEALSKTKKAANHIYGDFEIEIVEISPDFSERIVQLNDTD